MQGDHDGEAERAGAFAFEETALGHGLSPHPRAALVATTLEKTMIVML